MFSDERTRCTCTKQRGSRVLLSSYRHRRGNFTGRRDEILRERTKIAAENRQQRSARNDQQTRSWEDKTFGHTSTLATGKGKAERSPG